MKRRIALVFVLVVALATAGFSIWHLTRPTVGETITAHADDTLQKWGVPTDEPTVDPILHKPQTSFPKESTPGEGSTFAVIRIPALDLKFPIAQGTDDRTLKHAIGHYTQTALPGEVGNFAIAGHVCCESNGQPFRQLKKLKENDEIFIYTQHATYSYSVVNTVCGPSPSIVPMTRVEVIAPNPCSADPATQQLMTLQTCTDWNGAPATRRVIVWAKLRSIVAR